MFAIRNLGETELDLTNLWKIITKIVWHYNEITIGQRITNGEKAFEKIISQKNYCRGEHMIGNTRSTEHSPHPADKR